MIGSRRGNQAIEFALTAPLLLLMIAGVIDLGHYIFIADGVVNAIAQGARQGALADPDEGEDPAVLATTIASASWTAAELPGALTVNAATSGVDPNAVIVVSGSAPFTAFFGFLSLPTTVSYTSTVRLMTQPPAPPP